MQLLSNDNYHSDQTDAYGIRKLYMPVQPTVTESTPNVKYQEILPADKLRTFIYCYWQLKTTQLLEKAFHYRVVADGCIDIFFELNSPDESWVMGFCKKYTEFPLDNTFHYVGIRFLPTMFPQLFNVEASSLSNRYQNLHDVVPAVAKFIGDNMNTLSGSEEIGLSLDDYFINHLTRVNFNRDKRLYKAIGLILKNQGVLNVEKELDTGLSPRQLRRLFQFYIGGSAKTFAQVVRFQHILNAKPSHQSLKQNKLFYDAGYYDQAHFIKAFKNFYGVTPSRAFGR